MNLFKAFVAGINKKNISAFTLIEMLVVLFISVLVGVAVIYSVNSQSDSRQVAEVKTNFALYHARANQAVTRYVSTELFSRINNDPNLRDCFLEKGALCNSLAINFVGYEAAAGTVLTPYQTEMNRMMNGGYTLAQGNCNANCPVQVTTDWVFDCSSNSCKSITFQVQTTLNQAVLPAQQGAIYSNIIPLSSTVLYTHNRDFGLKTTIATSCEVVTGVTGTQTVCSSAASNSNRLFASDLGAQFQSTAFGLAANCPPGKTMKMTPTGFVCNSECTVLCTKPNHTVVPDCTCCDANNGGWRDVTTSSEYVAQKNCDNPLPGQCGVTCPDIAGWQHFTMSNVKTARKCINEGINGRFVRQANGEDHWWCDPPPCYTPRGSCAAGCGWSSGACRPMAPNGGWGAWWLFKDCDYYNQTRQTSARIMRRLCDYPMQDYAGSTCSQGGYQDAQGSGCLYYNGWYNKVTGEFTDRNVPQYSGCYEGGGSWPGYRVHDEANFAVADFYCVSTLAPH